MHATKQKASVPAEDEASGRRLEGLRQPELVAEQDPGPADGVRVTAEWVKLQGLALRQLDRFMSLEPKVLRGEDPEAIHDMRVASRRLQQVLDLIYPPPAPREVRRLRRRIRRCRRVLGQVRNCDVLLQRVEKSLANKRNSQHAIWEIARDYLEARRSESFDKALGKLGKSNIAGLYVGLKEHLTVNSDGSQRGNPGQAEEPQSYRANPALPLDTPQFYDRVGHSLESAWKDFVDKVGESQRQPEASTLHGVRIAAKRLRYLVEVVEEFEVPGSGESLAWLRGLQQHLGDWHDLEVMEGTLTEMLARPKFIRDHLEMASDVLQLIRRNRRRKKAFEEKYLQVTRHSAEYERTERWATQLSSSPATAFPSLG